MEDYKDISREGESEGIEWLDGKREENKYRGEGGIRYKLKDEIITSSVSPD